MSVTPPLASGSPGLSYLRSVAQSVGENLKCAFTVVVPSEVRESYELHRGKRQDGSRWNLNQRAQTRAGFRRPRRALTASSYCAALPLPVLRQCRDSARRRRDRGQDGVEAPGAPTERTIRPAPA